MGLFGDLPTPVAQTCYQRIYVHFETLDDLKAFGELVGLNGISTAVKRMTWPLVSFGGGTAVPPAPAPERDHLFDVDELLMDAEQFEFNDSTEREVTDLVKRLEHALRAALRHEENA